MTSCRTRVYFKTLGQEHLGEISSRRLGVKDYLDYLDLAHHSVEGKGFFVGGLGSLSKTIALELRKRNPKEE